MSTTLGLLKRLGGQVRQVLCGLHGHDSLMHFEKKRLSLVCTSCGHQSPGWDVQSAPVAQSQTVAPKRRVIRMPILGERRIA